jgi:RNA polymerase sigma factor (sigma-70 family)
VTEVTDEIIMQHVKDGHLEQMTMLFERYHLRMYNFFLRMTFNKDISQDLTQNLFYRIIKYRNTYKSGYSFKSWIYQMARNLHMDLCREEKRSNELFQNTGSYPSDITIENENYNEDDYLRLENALMLLGTEQREILILSRYHGLKYEEISAITKQTVPAIKVAVHRAVKQLRGIYFKQI